MTEKVDCLVIGAGPAGLMAAEAVSKAGFRVVLADAMPSPARKFLMAGKSGLNLTYDAPAGEVSDQITWGEDRGMGALTRQIISEFPPEAIKLWANGLGITLFTGPTARVFPVEMKASPLLRAWLLRLAEQGVELRRKWRWTGLEDGVFSFDTPEGPATLRPRKAVLALGGASWPKLGSTGEWAGILQKNQVPFAPFQPANMGFFVTWSPEMQKNFGAPVKGVMISAGGISSRGEWVITSKGIEGGGIYKIATALRDGAQASLDLAPDMTHEKLVAKLAKQPPKNSLVRKLSNVLGDSVRVALAMEWAARSTNPVALARALKQVPMRVGQPFGIERAISSAGGVCGSGLTGALALKALPDIHLAGEMLDWEAPTGGYLLSMCLASGRYAGQAVARALQEADSSR